MSLIPCPTTSETREGRKFMMIEMMVEVYKLNLEFNPVEGQDIVMSTEFVERRWVEVGSSAPYGYKFVPLSGNGLVIRRRDK